MRNMIRERQLLVIFYFFYEIFILSISDLVWTTPIIDVTPVAASTVEYMIYSVSSYLRIQRDLSMFLNCNVLV